LECRARRFSCVSLALSGVGLGRKVDHERVVLAVREVSAHNGVGCRNVHDDRLLAGHGVLEVAGRPDVLADPNLMLPVVARLGGGGNGGRADGDGEEDARQGNQTIKTHVFPFHQMDFPTLERIDVT
jgi:hypothetical protein